MEMQSRKVLATNHVNEIMVKWLECGDWGEAFMKVIPKRKGGQLKKPNGQKGEAEDDGDDSDEEQAVMGETDEVAASALDQSGLDTEPKQAAGDENQN